MIGGLLMSITSNPLDNEITYPYITNLSYKGFHPIEKKKTIKNVNLLIAKFNEVNNDLYQNGLEIITNETNDNKFEKLLESNDLDAYRGITLTYHTDLYITSMQKLPSVLAERKRNFKKFIKSLTQPIKKLEDINTLVEENKYWNCCTGNDPKNLKFTNEYNNTILRQFSKEFGSEISTDTANTINKIKVLLLAKEEEKVEEAKTFLEKLNEYLEKEKNNNYKDDEKAKTIIGNLERAFKKLINILDKKSGSLTGSEIKIIEGYINLARVPEKINVPKDTSYFLPMIECYEGTKKIILKVMSAQTDAAGYGLLTKNISEYVKNNYKNIKIKSKKVKSNSTSVKNKSKEVKNKSKKVKSNSTSVSNKSKE